MSGGRPQNKQRFVADAGAARARARDVFDPTAANAESAEKLRSKSLRRRARARGLELRHSDHGYSLVDTERNRVGGRNDLSLDEVATHLEAAT